MRAVQIEVPAEIALSLKLPAELMESRLTEELAVHLYQQGLLTWGKARALACLSKWQFAEPLGQRRIARHYAQEDLAEDLEFAYGD